MDTRKLIEIFRASIDPNQREQAEEHLTQVHKIIGFAPAVLQVVMMNDIDMPVKQAGVIYLKNMVTSSWADKEQETGGGQPLEFNIHEQDRAMIRDAIVDAVVLAPEQIRIQLAVCVNNIVKHDFPARWTGIVDKISIFLQQPDTQPWFGALLCLYQLVKNFEYKKPEDRGPLNEAMQMLLPMIHQRMCVLIPDASETSVLLQKQILKVFFALVQYFLPLDLVTKETFQSWMEIVRVVIERPVPEETNKVDKDDRMELPWWKCKKWALHIVTRTFERYGSPGTVQKDYKSFADWYLKTFSGGIIEVLLKVLDSHRNKEYVSPRVLQLALSYLNQAVVHAYSWKFIKNHMPLLTQEVIFPILCFNDEDQELWDSDPHEYIRTKFDLFEDYISPVMAAQTLLHSAVKKRKMMLQRTMGFVMTVLIQQNVDPRQKDGALRMVGALADILLKKKLYKDQMELMLVTHVYPEFESPHGYMRARACWVMHYLSEVKFRNESNLVQAMASIQQCLLKDTELPVKVEAAIALQLMIANQDRAHKIIQPHVKEISLELLRVIRETENDDLTNVMQKLVYQYTDELMPIAVEISSHLAATFTQVIENDEGSDEKAITAMGILGTIETICNVFEENKEIVAQIEPIVCQVVGIIFNQNIMEFYEEAMGLVYSLTATAVSPTMWKVFEVIYHTFENDGFDYFTDMMPALHNYVTVDTATFVSSENNLLAVYNMCKSVLTGDPGEDTECHAAKLLEVVILQCKGQIDQCVPSFIQLALERLTREVKTSELRTMCLQIVIAALYYNPQLFFDTLEKIPLPANAVASSDQPVINHFVQQWIHDTDCFLGLHDRKLCVLGLCALLTHARQLPAVQENAAQIVPSLLLLFDGLKRAYAAKAKQDDSDEEETDDDEEYEQEALDSDEDDIDDEQVDYIESLDAKVMAASMIISQKKHHDRPEVGDEGEDDDEEDEDYDDDMEETDLESFTTPLDDENCAMDEYVVFKELLQSLQNADPSWYAHLTAHLKPEQQKQLHEVFVLADQRKAAAESKRIEESGGYVFQNQTVPTTFNFGIA